MGFHHLVDAFKGHTHSMRVCCNELLPLFSGTQLRMPYICTRIYELEVLPLSSAEVLVLYLK